MGDRRSEGARSSTATVSMSSVRSTRQAPAARFQPGSNREIGRLLSSYAIQARLVIAPASDRYESEADRVADAVMRMPVGGPPVGAGISSISASPVQRRCSECEDEKMQRRAAGDPSYLQRKCTKCEEEEELHRKASCGNVGGLSSSIESSINTARGEGHPIPTGLRRQLEPRFGTDFSGIRLHTDTGAANLAASVGAHAFTTRQDIFFAAGRYQPNTPEGRRLLAHELTHTIQQRQASGIATIQRDAADDNITEEEVRKQLAEREAVESVDTSPEEEAAAGESEEPIDEKKTTEEAKAAQAEQPSGEIVVPNFDTESEPCPKLWDEGPEPAAPAQAEEEPEEPLYSKLFSLTNPIALVGMIASAAWKALPLSVRAAAINKAIDGAIQGVNVLPGETLGPLWGWFQAGLTGFLSKLRKVDDKEKVVIFEKVGSMVLGLNARAQMGFGIGVLKGFFIDGLLGIVQMIIDIVCFVPRALKFIEKFAQFMKDLPEEMEAAWDAIKSLAASVKGAIGGAVDELKAIWKDPKRAIDLMKMVYEAGKSKAKEIGEMIADKLLEYARLPSQTLGEKIGRIVGQVAFEAVVTYLTAGAEAGISALKVAAKEALEWVVELGKKFFQVVKRLLPILEDIAHVIARAAKFLTKVFKTICDKINQAIQRVLDFFYSILGLCSEGSFKCKRYSHKKPKDKKKCLGRFVPRLGGFSPHDDYCRRVTNRSQDFRIVLGPVRRCTFDAKVGRMLVECKTGYGWLVSPVVQAKPWFGFARTALRAQSLRCLATAVSCGYTYVWYVQNAQAAAYLNAFFGGVPPVLHKP